MRQGYQLYSAADYQSAELSFQISRDQVPAIADFNLGATYYKQKEFDLAEIHFQKSLLNQVDRLKPSDVYYNLGNSQLKNGKTEKAIQSYKSCLRLNSSDKSAKHNLELALLALQTQKLQTQKLQTQKLQTQKLQKKTNSLLSANNVGDGDILISKQGAIRLLESFLTSEQVVHRQFLRRKLTNQRDSDKDW